MYNFKKNMVDKRLVSNREIYKIINNSNDFYKRSYNLTPIKIIYYFIILIFGSSFLMQALSGIISADLNKYKLDNLLTSMMIVNLLFIILVAAATYLVYRMNQIVLVSDFQSLLFSSAMREKTLFYIIFSKDTIFYNDENCKKFLNLKKNSNNISEILNELPINSNQKEQMVNSIENDQPFEIKLKKDENYINIKINPIDRPKGFFSMKGFTTT